MARSDKVLSLESEAAKFNTMVLKKLKKVLAEDPEVDLLSKFPSEYSARLAKRKTAIRDDGRCCDFLNIGRMANVSKQQCRKRGFPTKESKV
jgi:hypothetical protein